MHNGALRKWALALTFWLALHVAPLRAQTFTAPLQASTIGTNPVDFEFRADGTLIAKGNIGVGSLLTADMGSGTRMLWFAAQGAFRVGGVDNSGWDASNIGQYSTAFGFDTEASGTMSVAMGAGAVATGAASTAIGRAYAYGQYSTGIGGATASGDYSVAMGGSSAGGNGSTAMGSSAAPGGNSTSMGTGTASGYGSTALGYQVAAVGDYSLALGSFNYAYGRLTTVAGIYTIAHAYDSFVIGTYNVGGGDSDNWVSTDPLFEIGNGISTQTSDALVVYKNGNAVLQGTLDVAPGGDIPMYSGE
jgi:hypothetical protein